jgi:drug/metabolite transporter (DMT)-like permease
MSRRVSADALGGGFIGLASLQFGGVVVLGKIVTDGGLPIASFLAVRFGLAALFLALALAVLRQPLMAAKGEGWRLAALGMAGYALEAELFFAAIHHGSAPAVTLLFFTYPVLVTILSVALGQDRPARLAVVALVCAMSGAAIVVVAGHGLDISTAGVLFALGSALAFAVYLMGADAVLKKTNSLTGSMWVSAAAALALGAFALVTGEGQWPVGARQWAPVLASAAFTAGAFACLFAGLRRLGAVRASIIAATEPLSATLLAVVFLGEPLRPQTVAGGVLILAGAVTASIARRRIPAEPPMP